MANVMLAGLFFIIIEGADYRKVNIPTLDLEHN